VFDPRPALEAPAPGGMSADERALLVEMLEISRDRLRAALRDASDELWHRHRRPAGGGWSVAECAEHLVLSEEFFPGIIRGVILAAPENSSVAAKLRGIYNIVAPAMHDHSVKLETLPCLEPRGKWATRAVVTDAFLARRAVTLDYVRTTCDALHHHTARIGEMGLRDGYQWLLLLAAHTDRHVEQMREALSCV
jgi:DinB family protein